MAGFLAGAYSGYHLSDSNQVANSQVSISQRASVHTGKGAVNLGSITYPVTSEYDNRATTLGVGSTQSTSISGMKLSELSGADVGTPASGITVPEEEGSAQVIVSRMYDPSITLGDVMRSDEMQKLSDETRKRVIEQMVDMLNRGEIDVERFMPSGKQ